MHSKDHENDIISFSKNSDLILNDKEQSASQNVAITTIEVEFPQNKKLKPKSIHTKKISKDLENLYTCVISVIKFVKKT